MMNNMFSMFDPTSTFIGFKMNWLSMLIVMILLQMNYWVFLSQYMKLFLNLMIMIYKEMKQMISPSPIIFFLSLMMVIFINNLFGLLPYIFTSTSHIMLTLSMALMLWLTFNMYGWFKKTSDMFIHLVPMSTPNLLIPFMVLIESVSNIIRPITLSVRLMANMTAGHIMILLISSSCVNLSFKYSFIIIFIQISLMFLELAVAMIQAYVFTTLSSLYYNEIN
uniref:ATP synthase subunit a n=1 Tax=Tanystylum orbiculare TaxID=88027 RepID=E0XLE4_TANOR|nr:ATP synthase F0 subunit 6 [Tanystylum orbiculare]ADB91989.1 ATP synthase F0 subunit 6 [Tanystylum orbiculare]